MSDSHERRRNPRLSIHAEAMLSLIIPNQTFSTYTLRGVGTDISAGGMRIKTYQLPKDDAMALLKGMSHVKLELRIPVIEESIHLRGQVVWADYHDSTPSDPAHCFLGVSFYQFTEKARQDFLDVLEIVEARVARAGPSDPMAGVPLRREPRPG